MKRLQETLLMTISWDQGVWMMRKDQLDLDLPPVTVINSTVMEMAVKMTHLSTLEWDPLQSLQFEPGKNNYNFYLDLSLV